MYVYVRDDDHDYHQMTYQEIMAIIITTIMTILMTIIMTTILMTIIMAIKRSQSLSFHLLIFN